MECSLRARGGISVPAACVDTYFRKWVKKISNKNDLKVATDDHAKLKALPDVISVEFLVAFGVETQ